MIFKLKRHSDLCGPLSVNSLEIVFSVIIGLCTFGILVGVIGVVVKVPVVAFRGPV